MKLVSGFRDSFPLITVDYEDKALGVTEIVLPQRPDLFLCYPKKKYIHRSSINNNEFDPS